MADALATLMKDEKKGEKRGKKGEKGSASAMPGGGRWTIYSISTRRIQSVGAMTTLPRHGTKPLPLQLLILLTRNDVFLFELRGILALLSVQFLKIRLVVWNLEQSWPDVRVCVCF